jgi:hypothetical protein
MEGTGEYMQRQRRGMIKIAKECGLHEYLAYVEDEIEFEKAYDAAEKFPRRDAKENGGNLYNSEIWYMVFSPFSKDSESLGGHGEGAVMLLEAYLQHTEATGKSYYRAKKCREDLRRKGKNLHKKGKD